MRKFIWIFVIIVFIAFIVVQFYFSTSRGPVKTTWNEVRSTMLVNQDIERIVVINNKIVTIYLKKDRIENYKTQFDSNFSRPAEYGPHFSFNISSVETFENNLKEAQSSSGEEISIEYKEERNRAGEILWTIGPIILIILLPITYFIPTFIAKGKEKYKSILILNILTGWTILGWVGCLYWSITSPKRKNIFKHVCQKCGFEKKIDQKVKLFTCPNCYTENIIEN